MWTYIGEAFDKAEKKKGRWLSGAEVNRVMEAAKESFVVNLSSKGKDNLINPNHKRYGTISMIRDNAPMAVNAGIKCLYSANQSFTKDKYYIIKKNEIGKYLRSDTGRKIYLKDSFTDRYTKTYFQYIGNISMRRHLMDNSNYTREDLDEYKRKFGSLIPLFVKYFDEKEEKDLTNKMGEHMKHGIETTFYVKKNRNPDIRNLEGFEHMKKNCGYNEGDEMLSKTAINKLNGLKKGEEQLVELTQSVSEGKNLKLDLAKIIAESKAVKDLNLGKDALLTGVSIVQDRIDLFVSVGEVEKEETQVVLANLQKKLLSQGEE